MKDYERLTEKGAPYYPFEKCKTCEYGKDGCDNWCDQIRGCFCRLQELEDKIESGELVVYNDVIDHLMQAKDTSELTEKGIEFFVKHNEKVRKETAKEIYAKVKELNQRSGNANSGYVFQTELGIDHARQERLIKEFIKEQYNIDVEDEE